MVKAEDVYLGAFVTLKHNGEVCRVVDYANGHFTKPMFRVEHTSTNYRTGEIISADDIDPFAQIGLRKDTDLLTWITENPEKSSSGTVSNQR